VKKKGTPQILSSAVYFYGQRWQEMWVDNEYCVEETVCFLVGITFQYVTVSNADSTRPTSQQTIVSTGTFMRRLRRCQNGLLSSKRG